MTVKSALAALALVAPLSLAFASEAQTKQSHDAYGISPSQPAGFSSVYACGNHRRSASVLVPQGQRDGGQTRLYVWDSADNSEATLNLRGSVASAARKADDFCAGGFTPARKTTLPAASMQWTR